MLIKRYIPKRLRKDYYVYALFDECAIVRYIGKGKGKRWQHHEQGWRSASNKALGECIRITIEALGEVPKIKIRQCLTEFQAFAIENALVKAIGRVDLGTGPLLNLTDGGGGSQGFNYTEEQRKALSIAISAALQRVSPEERSERQRRREAARSPEARTASALKRAAAKTPEQRSKIAVNGGKAAGNAFWINNGKQNKRIEPNKPIPKGWTRGRINWDFPNFKICAQSRWINNGKEVKRLLLNQTLPSGWVYGRKPGLIPKVPTFLPGQRSDWMRRRHAAKSSEERSEIIRKGWRKITTQEARSQRVKGPNYDPEKRSAQVRKQQAELTPEQQANNIRNRSKGACWITNGEVRKQLAKDKPLPNGWYYGYKLKIASATAAQRRGTDT